MCGYTGRHFGAAYEDACCVDGHLYDLDSDDGDGMTIGGDIACPQCNTQQFLNDAKDDAESTSSGSSQGYHYCGSMIIEGAIGLAEKLNADEASKWKAKNSFVSTFDWPDREAVRSGRADPSITKEIKLIIA